MATAGVKIDWTAVTQTLLFGALFTWGIFLASDVKAADRVESDDSQVVAKSTQVTVAGLKDKETGPKKINTTTTEKNPPAEKYPPGSPFSEDPYAE